LTLLDFSKKFKKTNKKILKSEIIKNNFNKEKILNNDIFNIDIVKTKYNKFN
jgi:hypothetical protein